MSIDLSTEILSAHADRLNTGQPVDPQAFLAAYPDRHNELVPLLGLAMRVQHALAPVQPDSAFRARLRDGLVMAAHSQQAQRILVARRADPQWGWLLGAAAIGSAAGLLALVWRSRAQEHRVPAGSTELAPRAE